MIANAFKSLFQIPVGFHEMSPFRIVAHERHQFQIPVGFHEM